MAKIFSDAWATLTGRKNSLPEGDLMWFGEVILSHISLGIDHRIFFLIELWMYFLSEESTEVQTFNKKNITYADRLGQVYMQTVPQ